MNKNEIAFRKGFITCPDNAQDNKNEAALLQHMFLTYGYVLTEEAFNQVCKSDPAFIKTYHQEIEVVLEDYIGKTKGKTLSDLVEQLGSGQITTSLLSFFDLIWGKEGDITPVEAIYNTKIFNEIKYFTEEGFMGIFTSLAQINAALTPDDFKTIEWFTKEYGNKNRMPDTIPFKENLCMMASLGLDVPVKTSTDVLRIAVYMSTGTSFINLPPKMIRLNAWSRELSTNPRYEDAKFKKFNRKDRRIILALLDKVANPREMVLKRNRWIKLGEILHPGDYSSAYPRAYKAFDKLRNTDVKSWYSDVDAAFADSFEIGLSVLSGRPGEFGRRLDALLRNNPKYRDQVLLAFKECGRKISSKVLWELYTHFRNRDMPNQYRSVKIAGARSAVPLPVLPAMHTDIVEEVLNTILEIFFNKFADMDALGAVYIDEELKKIPLPTDMRTISSTLRVSVRGSRLPLEVGKTVFRPFIYWTAGVDLDLSMTFMNEGKDSRRLVCSYGNTRPAAFVKHSGDVIPHTKGEWREYIDINLKDNPYQYGILTVRNFRGTTLEDVGALVGFAEFDGRPNGDWLAKAVGNSFKVSSQGSNVVLLAVDFKTNEWILIDQDQAGIPAEIQNDSSAYLEHVIAEPKISVYDLLRMHAEARGTHVTEIENSDTVFKFEDFCLSYEKVAGLML